MQSYEKAQKFLGFLFVLSLRSQNLNRCMKHATFFFEAASQPIFTDCYHYESSVDGLLATMAVFPETGPVVLLAVQLSLFFIVPVREDTATFTASKTQKEVGSKGIAKQ